MGEGDVLVLEFTRTHAALQEILMNDGVLSGMTNVLSNTLGEPAFPQIAYGRPYVSVEPHKYHQVVRFLLYVGVRRAKHHWVWDSMPQRFVDVELGSWVESLVPSLQCRRNFRVRHKLPVCLGMAHAHFELQDYLAHTSHECVSGHLLTWP